MKIFGFYYLFPPQLHADDDERVHEAISTNLFNQIYSVMFVKYSKIIILLENGHRHAAGRKKNKDFVLLRGLAHQNLGNWISFLLIKVEIHTLSNDLMRNL
jgi:hypothetical protein